MGGCGDKLSKGIGVCFWLGPLSKKHLAGSSKKDQPRPSLKATADLLYELFIVWRAGRTQQIRPSLSGPELVSLRSSEVTPHPGCVGIRTMMHCGLLFPRRIREEYGVIHPRSQDLSVL
jgi:hypothetical protein